jgi:hypothetical protein
MTIPGEVSGRRFEVTTLPASLLDVDPDVQRMLNENRVRKLADSFDESALGIFTVSARESLDPAKNTISHRYVVLDGQTRLAALRRFAGTGDTTLPVVCQVYYGLTRQQEAETFLSHNDRAAVRAIDKFRLAIVAREPWALDLDRMVKEHGFEIGRGARPSHRFTAVAAARRIMSLTDGPDALNRAFDLLVRAWGHRRNSASAEAIDGIGLLYQRHGAAVDTVPFAAKLAGSDTPQTFKGGVLALYGSESIHRTEAAYRYTVRLYNLGRKSDKYKLQAQGPRS